MAHLGILQLAPEWEPRVESRLMWARQKHYFYADRDGVFEPAAELGAEVAGGERAGIILTPETPLQPAHPVLFPDSGKWICTRAIGRVRRGDCLGHLLVDAPRNEVLSDA